MDPKIVRAANEMLLDPNHDFDKILADKNKFKINEYNYSAALTLELDKATPYASILIYEDPLLAILGKAYKIVHHSYTSPQFSISLTGSSPASSSLIKYSVNISGVNAMNNLVALKEKDIENLLNTLNDIQKAYIPLKALQSELETQMGICVNGIKDILEQPEGTMQEKSDIIADHINSFAEQFSSLPKEEISQKVKALTKEIISAQETGKDWTYPFKEACKWIFSGLGFKGDLSNSQKIDIAFGKIENDIAIKNSDKRHNNAAIDVKKNPAILQAFKSMKADKTSNNKVNVVTAGHHKKEDVIKAK